MQQGDAMQGTLVVCVCVCVCLRARARIVAAGGE